MADDKFSPELLLSFSGAGKGRLYQSVAWWGNVPFPFLRPNGASLCLVSAHAQSPLLTARCVARRLWVSRAASPRRVGAEGRRCLAVPEHAPSRCAPDALCALSPALRDNKCHGREWGSRSLMLWESGAAAACPTCSPRDARVGLRCGHRTCLDESSCLSYAPVVDTCWSSGRTSAEE